MRSRIVTVADLARRWEATVRRGARCLRVNRIERALVGLVTDGHPRQDR